MTNLQLIGLIFSLSSSMIIGFISGYYVGYDRTINELKKDPRNSESYRWPKLRINCIRAEDHKLVREIHKWVTTHLHKKDFDFIVVGNGQNFAPPVATFFIKNPNIALTLSIKFNISYTPGYGSGYQ